MGFAMLGVFGRDRGRGLAGLAGVPVLELRCVNFFGAVHALLWHAAVAPVSAAGGAFIGQYRLSRIARGVRHI